jgi:hypothetical protein
MSDNEDDYHTQQRKWEELNQWGKEHPEEWEEHELLNNEELLAGIEAKPSLPLLLSIPSKDTKLTHRPTVNAQEESKLEKSTVMTPTKDTMNA